MFCPNCGHENNDENKFCMKCGKPFQQKLQDTNQNVNSNVQPAPSFAAQNYPYIPVPFDNCIYTKGAKIIRLVVGIISMVLPLLILLQSCASGIINIFENPDAADGTAGFLLSIFMLTAGIISVAARKTRGGTITAISFYLLGTVISDIDVAVFKDLIIWSYVSLIFAILLIISLAMKKDSANCKKISLDVIIIGIITLIIAAIMVLYGGSKSKSDGAESSVTSDSIEVIEESVTEITADKIQTTEEPEKVIETKPEPTEEKVINSSDKSIISGIHNGMTQTDVISLLGDNFETEYYDESNYYYVKTVYNYKTSNVDVFNINMPAIMFFEFSESGKLFNYGYHIGFDGVNYKYDLSKLSPAYEKINLQLTEWYGPGAKETNDFIGIDQILTWSTEYGDIWFVVGENMWSENSGINEITLSCEDESWKTSSEDEEDEMINGVSYRIEDTKGQINCHGGIVPGYTTSYVCDGGTRETVRQSQGDTWHVTAKNICVNYGITWCELWDSDDGDYYGWVDADYIDFY